MNNSVLTVTENEKENAYNFRYIESANTINSDIDNIINYEWSIFFDVHDICKFSNIPIAFINRYIDEEHNHKTNKKIISLLTTFFPSVLSKYMVYLANGTYFSPYTCFKLISNHSNKEICRTFCIDYEMLTEIELNSLKELLDHLETKRDYYCTEYYYDLNEGYYNELYDLEYYESKQDEINHIEHKIRLVMNDIKKIESDVSCLWLDFDNKYSK